MSLKVYSIPVTVYGNIVGWFPNGITVQLDCSARKIESDTVNPAVGGQCLRLEPGGVWPDGASAGFTTQNTVKVNTADGFVWMKDTDYTAYLTACNSCCVE